MQDPEGEDGQVHMEWDEVTADKIDALFATLNETEAQEQLDRQQKVEKVGFKWERQYFKLVIKILDGKATDKEKAKACSIETARKIKKRWAPGYDRFNLHAKACVDFQLKKKSQDVRDRVGELQLVQKMRDRYQGMK